MSPGAQWPSYLQLAPSGRLVLIGLVGHRCRYELSTVTPRVADARRVGGGEPSVDELAGEEVVSLSLGALMPDVGGPFLVRGDWSEA